MIRPFPTRRSSPGFSLVELSVVIAVLAVVAVAGLEAFSIYMNRTAYNVTRERLAVIQTALNKHRFVFGYLPCPAPRGIAITNIGYAKEGRNGSLECTAPRMDGVYYGPIPVRDLNLPLRYARDGYGGLMSYMVSYQLTQAGTGTDQFSNAASVGVVKVRTGKIEQPCTSQCQEIASAAYMVISHGRDQRGAGSLQCLPAANTATDGMIDTVNCRFGGAQPVRVNGSGATAAIPDGVFYDSRYNDGSNEEMHFDDLVIWQTKSQL